MGLLDDVEMTLGTRLEGRRRGTPLVLRGAHALQHKQVAGRTGAGKSKFLVGLVVQAINQGLGGIFLDPAGDAVEDVLQALLDLGFYADARTRAWERVWYVPFSCPDRFVPFNVLATPAGGAGAEPHALARGVMEGFSRAWRGLDTGQAPQLENLVLFGSFVLIQNQQPLTALGRLLMDAPYRHSLLAQVSDHEVRAFFIEHFDAQGRRAGLLSESTLRRLHLLAFMPALRYTLGQSTNRLTWRRLLDSGVMVLLDLRNLDQETTRLLGSLITVGVETAILSRADQPEEQRRPALVVLDEFAQFASGSEVAMERTLALARKFQVGLVLAHQNWSQIGHKLQGALQNAMLICFRTGQQDSELAAEQLAEYDPYRVKDVNRWGTPTYFSAAEQRQQCQRELQRLATSQALVRLGEEARTETVRLQTVTIPEPRCSRVELNAIQERYAQLLLTPREQIEREAGQHRGGGVPGRNEPTSATAVGALGAPASGETPAALETDRRTSAARFPRVRRRVPLAHEQERLSQEHGR